MENAALSFVERKKRAVFLNKRNKNVFICVTTPNY